MYVIVPQIRAPEHKTDCHLSVTKCVCLMVDRIVNAAGIAPEIHNPQLGLIIEGENFDFLNEF